jgi:D-aminoacyl-tRNA deacylase
VEVAGETVGAIEAGLLVYLGAGKQDTPTDPAWMADKLAKLRIFSDEQGKFAHSVLDIRGEVLIVSQFTLYGDTRRGRRPSFDAAAPPEAAERAYLAVCEALRELGLRVATGQFRAKMDVHAVVAGPVTILLDSEKQF